jgi:uncharacterized OsmC-like protein
MSPLENSERPLFFKVENPDELGLEAPPDRRGEAVRTYIRALSEMQKEALVIGRRSGNAWRLASDEGAYLMGEDVAPCPLAFLTTGMVASYMNEILALAEQQAIDLRNIRLIQDNFYTMEGSALRGTMVGGALPVELTAEIDAESDRATLLKLLYDATAASPLNGLMRGEHHSLFTLTHNGRQIETGKAGAIDGPAEPDPGDRFEASRPAEGGWSGHVVRNGMTPQTAEATSSLGSSYDENQSRRLHARGICTLRADGVKRIEQHLYNPHGSVFRFLSDEAPGAGGQGLAPDAASYVSAGIGFCFMTQFGRYAKIAKKDLRDYRVVQDTHFSLGGASGRTGKAGEADPVETHVHLETGEDDEFARTALDMAEQTCFLHAFCRTDLKTKVRLADSKDAAA